MNSYIPRTLIIALISILLGSGIDYLTGLETALGLNSLFKLRGTRIPPAEVVVVAMDETSESRLGLGQDLTRWRGFHAQLIKQLQLQGAALIVFDLQFIVPQTEQDSVLAAAMRQTGNVLLSECVQKLLRGVEGFYGRDECSESNHESFVQKEGGPEQPLSEQLIAMRRITANSTLVESALDHAPFYLTNDAENSTVREVWTFFDNLAETPALPVVAWFYYLQHTGALQEIAPVNTPLSAWLTAQRRQCSFVANNFSKNIPSSDLEKRINNVICQGESRYLDFYGPPQTLRMESYSDVYDGKVTNLQGKVVFVGKANRKYSPGKTDYFQTPFSDTRSGKMAGVEIMATQFANLLEGRFIESPLPPNIVFLLFGLVVGLLVTQFAGLSGLVASLLVSGAYAGLALWCFTRSGLWLPVAVPLLIQLPVSWLISLMWSRRDLLNERKRIIVFIRQVFPQWMQFLPASPGQWYPEQNTTELTFERDVRGLCLATDIEGYTAIAAKHTPHQMWELLNEYYQVLGYPVSSNDGIIADVTGDAMMAVWLDLPVISQRLAACLAALEMELAVARFNETSSLGRLTTRIGLHEGDMTLGRLGAGEGSYYRAIGDTVNIASRIQGVNKFLGTQILASAPIADDLEDVICRPVGAFYVVGREEPLELIEIVGRKSDVNNAKLALHKKFAQGLTLFQQGHWQEATGCFQSLLDQYGYDGPANFYFDLALTYQEHPPLLWQGVITFNEK